MKPCEKMRFVWLVVVAVVLSQGTSAAAALPSKLREAAPEEVGMNCRSLDEIDQVVAKGIEAGEMPGCVVMIGRRGKVVFFKAYGDRQVEPDRVAMTTDDESFATALQTLCDFAASFA